MTKIAKTDFKIKRESKGKKNFFTKCESYSSHIFMGITVKTREWLKGIKKKKETKGEKKKEKTKKRQKKN